jgi:ComF family protein
MPSSFVKIWETVLDILFPPLCTLCEKTMNRDEREDGICASCISSIPVKTAFTCPKCRARLAENKKVCHKDMPFYLAAALPYGDERVKKLIWKLKYEKHTYAARSLARLMREHLEAVGVSPSDFTFVPIPLHKSRERERGFNQSELIGAFIANAFQLPFERKALIRIKKTSAQAETKNRNERKENMAGAFSARESIVKNKNIFLVDDVYTSGATIEEAVRTLKKAGAKHVVALVAALA